MLTPEEINENYEKFVALALKTGDHRTGALEKFFLHLGERIAVCPASSRLEYHNAFPGGLVDHSLRVLRNCNKLAQVFKDELPVSREEMIFACLFHDIGKLGDTKNERYVRQTSDWHFRQGMVYEINKKMLFMPSSQMGLYLMQHFGVLLTYQEYMSILLNDGPVLPENKQYTMHEPILALLVHQADRLACEMEKEAQIDVQE